VAPLERSHLNLSSNSHIFLNPPGPPGTDLGIPCHGAGKMAGSDADRFYQANAWEKAVGALRGDFQAFAW